MKKKILITGGTGDFAQHFKQFSKKYKIVLPDKKTLNVLNPKQIKKFFNKIKPNYVIHNAALSRPMSIHDQNIVLSINNNIIGTCNIVNACYEKKIKLIYFSSNYVYPGTKGNYKETDSVFPSNRYAWSKLGGECAVQMYDNSLILRLAITKRPFLYKKAYTNVYSSFIYHEEAAKTVIKLINKKGIINIGGRKKSIYKFAKAENILIKPVKFKFEKKTNIIKDSSININKMLKLVKK